MMSKIVPPARPRLTLAGFRTYLERIGVDLDALWARYPLVLGGIRGYYLRTMGDPQKNDRGMYDDAIVVATPRVFRAFNGNTDPSRFRPGYGTAEATKGMGRLKGDMLHIAHMFGPHRGRPALRQAGPLMVIRDGDPDYECVAGPECGFNIHPGGEWSTGSEGCQTIYPPQWAEFYALAEGEAKHYYGDAWDRKFVPYALIEEIERDGR